jgi:hypothetical protein
MGEQPLFEAVQDADYEPKDMEGATAWSCLADQLLALLAVVCCLAWRAPTHLRLL